MKKTLLALALTVLATGSAMAQITLSNDWKQTATAVTSPFAGSFGWFSSADNLTRGFDVNVSANKIYVASRTGGNLIRIISTAGVDSATSLEPLTGGYTGGTFVINKVGVAGDNVIYGSNLALAAGPFTIYRHADDVTAATVAFTLPSAAARMGDDLDIKGAGNSTQILVAGSGSPTVSVFTTVDAGLTFTSAAVTGSAPAFAGTPHIAWDTTSGFWFRGAGSAGGKYDAAGVGAGQSAPRNASTLYGPIDVAGNFGVIATPVYALSSGNVGAGNTIIQGEIYAQSDLAPTVIPYVSDSIRPTAGMFANLNAAGDVYIDSVNSKVYWLVTNNVIARDGIAVADATDWNTYF